MSSTWWAIIAIIVLLIAALLLGAFDATEYRNIASNALRN
ncbi:hypothetical protein BQ9231_00121 [Cedratvirus lausannensis]|uniref:Uncharacterized protein n=1 Tax=Cedratvirus lausannensis TaxID=2023205 RepID=A0A285PWL2_9VIRU|nr:hypothetical protein BQ9231_00121 [Cedratvirus lausannensis]